MLQFDRHPVNGSRFIRGSHSKPPTDFVSRNKRAIRDRSRSQAAVAKNASTTITADQRAKGRPKAQERKREAGNGGKQAAEGATSDTVVISKSYLNELLRMSVNVRDEARGKNTTNSDQVAPKSSVGNGARREESGRHVDIEASEIPGLSNVSTIKHVATIPMQQTVHVPHTRHAQKSITQQANYQGCIPQHTGNTGMPAAPQANGQGLSPREKWLQELAAQVEEQKAKKERNRLSEQQSKVEEYFPFGRPGGGAPIKSQSGTLLTDYRSRTRIQEQGGMATRDHLDTNYAGNVQMPQEHTSFQAAHVHEGNSYGGYVHVPSQQPATNAYHSSVASNTGLNIGGDVMMMSPRRGEAQQQPQHQDTYNTTPQFARGAGPHVDQYMRKEMDEKRRKQMENMEFVRQQVAEKERVKREERLRREREDAIEEARLARERERMKANFEREKEKARRKELEAMQRQALLQQRILEAEESARRAKLEARGVIVNTNCHPTVSFDEYTTVSRSMASDFPGEGGVYSSLSKSDFRSPSMLQLANATTETGHHGDGNAPPTQRGRANGARKGRAIGQSMVADERERQVDQKVVKRRNSRIPVIQQSAASKAVATKSKGEMSSKVDLSVRSNKILTKRPREGGVRLREGRVRPVNVAAVKAAAVRPVVMERNYSPPVPALAKRLKQQPSTLPKKDSVQLLTQGRNMQEDVNFIRSISPPVPAVAKKLKNGMLENDDHRTEAVLPSYRRTASPPLPAVAKRMRDVDMESGSVPEVTQPLYQRTTSPPVPAVAKRLRNGASNDNHSTSQYEKREASNDRALSPPIPTVAKRLQQNDTKLDTVSGKGQPTPLMTEALNSELKFEFSRGLLAGDSEILINRPPSCKPDSKPLSPIAMTTNLPVIATATANHHHDNQGGMPHPSSSNRQRLILQQLTMLKEGILTQRNSIDHRVKTILTRDKQCNF